MKSFRYLQFTLILLWVLAQLIYVTHESAHLHDNPQECQICLHAWSGDAALTAEPTPGFQSLSCHLRSAALISANDLYALFDDTIQRLLDSLEKKQ